MDERDSRAGGARLATPTADVLKAAIREHQAGRLAEAAGLYSQVLADQDANVAALHLLGVIRNQQGDHAQAVELIGRAAALRPDVAIIQAGLAEALLAVGEPQRAADCARAALCSGPDDPSVRWILGQALEAAGYHKAAVLELVQAIRLNPEFAHAYNSLGNSLRSLGQLPEAKAAYHHAIRLAPGLAAPYANLGVVLLQEARHAEAREPLERAIELEPTRASSWESLAELYERMERFDVSIPCRERVLALSSGERAGPHLSLGRALRKDNRSDEAEGHFLRAVAIEPASADARFHLGVLREEQGDFAQAEACFREAIRLRPDYDLARARLVKLLRTALPDADLAALVDRLGDSAMDTESRVRLLFSQGQVLDARGEYPRAAACLREANALSLTLARGDLQFRPETADQLVDESVQAFTRDFFIKATGAGLDTRLPVFIVGLPRSGTTLIEQILASHPRVRGAGELAQMQHTFESLPSLVDSDATPAECVPRLDPILIRSLAGTCFNRLRELGGSQAERVIDKMPENYKNLGLISALFPSATIIHCRRDLRDVALSCWMTDFLSVRWAHDPAHIAATFRAYLRFMDHWRTVLPATIHDVAYEETVADLEGVARRLIAALGLEWDPACLEFHRTQRMVCTGSQHQVRQPLYRHSVGRWKHYEHELAELFAALPPPLPSDLDRRPYNP
ncbi:MAG: sulfotransferase [Isosphaeraceae bacterium]|nr:sulfotransferase [Isosphaeraceae bacterium]